MRPLRHRRPSRLTASASDPENRLSKVEFYNGSTLLASDTSAPYSFTWSSVPAGSYSVRAVAHDSDGASTTSATVSVTVTGAVRASRRATESGHRRASDCRQRPAQQRHLYGSRRWRGHLGYQRPVPFRVSAVHWRRRHHRPRGVAASRQSLVQSRRHDSRDADRRLTACVCASHGRQRVSADAAHQYFGHLQQHRRRDLWLATRMGPADSPRQYL